MKRTLRPNAFALLLALVAAPAAAQPDKPEESEAAPAAQEVRYFRQAIAEKQNETLRLFGGSWWVLSRRKLAPLADVIVIVLHEEGRGTAYIDGEAIPIAHLRGDFTAALGRLTTLAASIDTGEAIQLEEGSTWKIPKYDHARSGSWSPPDAILVTASEHYLINLRTGEKIWARRSE